MYIYFSRTETKFIKKENSFILKWEANKYFPFINMRPKSQGHGDINMQFQTPQ